MNFQVEKPKVDLYRARTFGQKFSATFDFIKENYKLLLKACFYLILPVCLFQAFALEWLISIDVDNNLAVAVDNAYSDGALWNLLVNRVLLPLIWIVCLVLGSILLSSICFAMIRYYTESPTRLQGVTLRDLKPLIIQSMKRSFLLGLVFAVAWVVITIILRRFDSFFLDLILSARFPEFLTGIGLLFLFIIGLLVAFVTANLSWSVYIFEDDENVFSSIRRGWRLGVHSFWSLIGLLLLIGIVGNILQIETALPWFFMNLEKGFISAASKGATSVVYSLIYSFIEYIFSVIMNFGTYLAMSLTVVALAFYYGSIAEEVDGDSVEEGFQNFEQLAEKDSDIDDFDKL